MKDTTKRIIELRQSGNSYRQIRKKTGSSMSNISYLCNRYVQNNLSLCKRYETNLKKLEKSERKAAVGRYLYYEKQRQEMIKYWSKLLKTQPLAQTTYIAGLYDGEGLNGQTEFSISNCNRHIIMFIRKYLKQIGAKFTCSLYLHPTHPREQCYKHWRFKIHSEIRASPGKQKRGKQNKYKENYGTIKLRVKNPLGLKEALSKYSYSFRRV